METNQQRWNRLLLFSFWVVLAISIGVELLYMFFVTEMSKADFLIPYILRPSLTMAVVVILAETAVRFLPSRHHDFVLITASAILAIVVTAVHSTLDHLLFFLFFPIMISIFYFQYKKLVYAILHAFASLYLLYAYNPEIHNRISLVGLLSMTILVAVYSGIAFGVLTRGRETLQNLRTSYESNQELLVRNILMDKLAKTDALTDTYNHMAFHEYIEKLVEQADNGRLQLQIALMDIDSFKSVNDTYGHRSGDAVLREVAKIAQSKVGANDFVARYGGEEFVILFTDLDHAGVYNTMEHIRRSIASTSHESLKGEAVTVSIGLNRYVAGMGKEQFFNGADLALYTAKRTGKNRTVIAEPPARIHTAGAAASSE
jgi:diguanylate cyclase (GGDEF)-like protein